MAKRLAVFAAALVFVAWVALPNPDYAVAAAVQVPVQTDVACGVPVSAPVAGDKITIEELATLTRGVGFAEFGEDVLLDAVATFWHEGAQGSVKVRNPTSGAAGLAQIMPANYKRLGLDPDVPEQNLRMAKMLADERVAQGRDPLGPWESWTTGRHRQYLDEARSALAGGVTPAAPCSAVTQAVDASVVKSGANGQLPQSSLCRVSFAPMDTTGLLQCAAAASLEKMAQAYAAELGKPMCFGNGYRTLAGQYAIFDIKPALAAKPGTSNHGWGLAVDFCGGVQSFGTREHRWMQQRAGSFGWVHPEWAQAGGSRPEAWHWEYGDQS